MHERVLIYKRTKRATDVRLFSTDTKNDYADASFALRDNTWRGNALCKKDTCHMFCPLFGWLGGNGEGVPPDPIPNSDVKPLSADGTAS